MEQRKMEEAKLSEYVGLGGLDDEDAQALAERVVREVRRELARDRKPVDGPAPSPEEVRRILAAKRSRREGGEL